MDFDSSQVRTWCDIDSSGGGWIEDTWEICSHVIFPRPLPPELFGTILVKVIILFLGAQIIAARGKTAEDESAIRL
jgi:hypothetical protein